MLDLNDRFDYYVCMLLKDDKLSLSDLVVPPQPDAASPKARRSTRLTGLDLKQRQLLAQFREFSQYAKSADLGGRQAERDMEEKRALARDRNKMGAKWLQDLEQLRDVEEESERQSMQASIIEPKTSELL